MRASSSEIVAFVAWSARVDRHIAAAKSAARGVNCAAARSKLRHTLTPRQISPRRSANCQAMSDDDSSEPEWVSQHSAQKAALPLSSLFEALLRRTVSVVLRNDNDTAVLDVERGYSRALAYLIKHQRLSLGAMHEDLICDANNALVRCNTKRMLADVLTKPLDHVRHWTLLAMLGMSLPSGELPNF